MTTQSTSEATALTARLRAISPQFAAAALHLSSAMRSELLEVLSTAETDGVQAAMAKLEAMKDSRLVVGVTNMLLDARAKIGELLDAVKECGTFAQLIVGLVAVAGAYAAFDAGMALLCIALLVAGIALAFPAAMSLWGWNASMFSIG